MPFDTWAEFLCGHEGAEEENRLIQELAAKFKHGCEPVKKGDLKGEEASLFLGIASDASLLFIHHLMNLGGTRRSPDPALVAIVGLQKSTTVVGLLKDCFENLPAGGAGIPVPPFSKLSRAATPAKFTAVEPPEKDPPTFSSLTLLPVPPFLIPSMTAIAHGSFAELGHACAHAVFNCKLKSTSGEEVSTDPHCHRLVQFMWWAAQKKGQETDSVEDYRTSIVLFADPPTPSHVKYRDAAVMESLGPTIQPTTTPQPGARRGAGSDPAITGMIVGLKESLESVML
jgi:hypothetical protein